MTEEKNRLIKLIERKNKFLEKATNQKIIDAVKTEIFLIQSFIEAAENQKNELSTITSSQQKTIDKKNIETETLITICLLHGIDLAQYKHTSLQVLKYQLQQNKNENMCHVPELLKNQIN